MHCPKCSCLSQVEVNLKADGYARNLFECGLCGAVWTLAGESKIVVSGGGVEAAETLR